MEIAARQVKVKVKVKSLLLTTGNQQQHPLTHCPSHRGLLYPLTTTGLEYYLYCNRAYYWNTRVTRIKIALRLGHFKNRQKNLVDCCVVVIVIVVLGGPGCCNRESIKHPIGCRYTLVLLVAAASRRRHQQPLFGLLVFPQLTTSNLYCY